MRTPLSSIGHRKFFLFINICALTSISSLIILFLVRQTSITAIESALLITNPLGAATDVSAIVQTAGTVALQLPFGGSTRVYICKSKASEALAIHPQKGQARLCDVLSPKKISLLRMTIPLKNFSTDTQLIIEANQVIWLLIATPLGLIFSLLLHYVYFSWKKRLYQQHQTEADESLGKLAMQVAHDISSPLSTLETIANNSIPLPKEVSVIFQHSLARIRGIVSDLVPKRSTHELHSATRDDIFFIEEFIAIVQGMLKEKRIQYQDRYNFKFASQTTFKIIRCRIQIQEFERLLSNILNNAAEASPEGSTILINIAFRGHSLELAVLDPGKGIPYALLPQLCRRGATYGKTGGNGLGLAHARKSIESWGGSLDIQSTVGEGTEVTIRLPIFDVPAPNETWDAVLVDNDSLVRMTWKMAAKRTGKKLLVFENSDALFSGAAKLPPETRFFVDVDLGEPETGDIFAERLHQRGFKDISLCTGHSPETYSKLTWLSGVVGKDPPFG